MTKKKNYIILVLLWVLAAIPFRDGLISNEIVGAGPDVVSTLWGMWWLQKEGVGAVFGSETNLVNFPYGAMGIVLAPSSAILWGVLEPLLGIGRAMAIVCWIQVGGFAWATAWLAKITGIEEPWHWVAGLAVLTARFMIFGIGEASLVAVIAIGIPIGIGAMLLAVREDRLKWYALACFSAVWMAMENPYVAPVLPGVLFLLALRLKDRRWKLLGTLVLTSIGILSVAAAYGASANPNYPREVAGQTVNLFGYTWKIVDLPWARLKYWEIFFPSDVSWTTSTQDAILAKGGRYLGLTVILFTAWGLRAKKIRWFFALGVICLVVSLGSIQGTLALPFLFLNGLMDAISRPLTQPTRFLVVTITCFSVCAAYGVWKISQRSSRLGIVMVIILLIDAVLFGGLSLKPPNTSMPSLSCHIEGGAGVLIWPEDGRNGELGTSRLLQIQHEKPSVQIGIASWRLLEKRALGDIRGAGFSLTEREWDEKQLIKIGFTSVFVEKRARELPISTSRLKDCGDLYWVSLEE